MIHIHTINIKVHRSQRRVTAAVAVALLQKVGAPPSVSLKWCSSDSFTLSDIVHCESSSPFCPSYGSLQGNPHGTVHGESHFKCKCKCCRRK